MLVSNKSKTPFSDGIKRIIFNERRNCNILIVGKTQTRKSTTAITLARALSKRFNLDKHMAVMAVKPLLNILNNEKLYRGDVVLADDFGVGMNHREWHNFLHKALNLSMQTHGFKGIIVIVTVPYQKFIDADTRLLFDYEITTLSKNDSLRFTKVKIEELQHTEVRAGVMYTYKHFIRMKCDDGQYRMIKSFNIPYPPKEIMDHYYEVVNESKKKLQWDLHTEADNIERKNVAKTFSADFYVEEVLKDQQAFFKTYHGKTFLDLSLIKNKFNVGIVRARQIKNVAEKVIEDTKVQERDRPGNQPEAHGNDAEQML